MRLGKDETEQVVASVERQDPQAALELRARGFIDDATVDLVQESLLDLMLHSGIGSDGEPSHLARGIDDLCGSIRHAIILGEVVYLHNLA